MDGAESIMVNMNSDKIAMLIAIGILFGCLGNNQMPVGDNGSNKNIDNQIDQNHPTVIEKNETQTMPGTYEYDNNTPVYVTIYTHNEDGWEGEVGTKTKYLGYRTNLIDRLNLIHDYGAKLNWQSDWGVLLAMTQYEKEELWGDTNGKHIIEYMVDDLGFSADPHTHATTYNYADVAYLFELNNITPSGVIGGVATLGCENGKMIYNNWKEVTSLQDDGYVYGNIYPEAKWRPTILAVPAMPGHYFDEFSSGIWKPGTDVIDNDPNGDVIYVGQGYPHNQNGLGITHASGALIHVENGDYIKELVEKIKNGEVPSGKMYTASIHLQDKRINRDSLIEGGVDVNEGLQEILEELKPLADAGYIKYVTYQEAVDIWKTEYNEEPNRLGLESFSIYDESYATGQEHCEEINS